MLVFFRMECRLLRIVHCRDARNGWSYSDFAGEFSDEGDFVCDGALP